MEDRRAKLAYAGKWEELLELLTEHPHLINSASENSGYTTLHQAAWHGADVQVIGSLLSLGANPNLRTSKDQTPHDIVLSKHPVRNDLEYLLLPGHRSLPQLMRKMVAENAGLFDDYDGNQLVYDRLVALFAQDFSPYAFEDIEVRFEAAYCALTGVHLGANEEMVLSPAEHFEMVSRSEFWRRRFLPLLKQYLSNAEGIPLHPHWATVSDLFDPAPTSWGLRGDLFLWIEMRHVLCHIPIPADGEELSNLVASAFELCVGSPLSDARDTAVKRLARGGMSSGMVSGEFWKSTFVPTLVRRADWLRKAYFGRSRVFE